MNRSSNPYHPHHGTAQPQRRSVALATDYVSIDERSLPELLAYLTDYARYLRFFELEGYRPKDGIFSDWSKVLEKDEAVFLAKIITTDFSSIDEEVQNAFLRMHQLENEAAQLENFSHLVNAVLKLSEILNQWYLGAKKHHDENGRHRIETEIERAIRGDLGMHFDYLSEQLNAQDGAKTFNQFEQWEEIVSGLQSSWPLSKREKLPGKALKISSEDSLEDYLNAVAILIREYYQRLYFTVAYVAELSPQLFELSINTKDDHQPDIGLMISFLQLFGHAQDELNQLTGRHLDYYYEQVLGQCRLPAVPDRTIVSFLATPGVPETLLPAGSLVSAGVNAAGNPSNYRTTADLLVTQAKIAALKTLFVSKNPIVKTGSSYQLVTAIYAAAVANSLDGNGMPFETAEQSWPVLGEDQFDLAQSDQQMQRSRLGFSLSAGVLALGEGERCVAIELNFTDTSFATLKSILEDIVENSDGKKNLASVFQSVFKEAFEISLSSTEGWWTIEHYALRPAWEVGKEKAISSPPSSLLLSFELPKSAPPIVAYEAKTHGGNWETDHPVLKVLVSDEQAIYAYSFLRELELETIKIDVEVKGLKSLTIYNDQGQLDGSAPFVPFGPAPRKKGYFLFGHQELFNRELTELDITIDWSELPEGPGGLAEHYAAYPAEVSDEDFQFRLSALSNYEFHPFREEQRDSLPLFEVRHGMETPLQSRRLIELRGEALKKLNIKPLYGLSELEPYSNQSRTGFFRLRLAEPKMAFGHGIYPALFARMVAEQSRPKPFSLLPKAEEESDNYQLPNEPYTPVIERLSVNYCATTSLNFRKEEIRENQLESGNSLLRLHPFGTEKVFDGKLRSTPYLVPRFTADGYLFIGIKDLRPPEIISIFFDISDSEKKIRRTPLELEWRYLSRGKWIPFGPDEIVYDGTLKLTTRGMVYLRCPAEISLGSDLLGPDLYWIGVAGAGNMDISGRCREVVAQVAEVEWIDNQDLSHLASEEALLPRINAMVDSRLTIAKVRQLRPFYGGKPQERLEDFYIRTSERLRHKNRGINGWDIERLVLQAFPDIYQVKCIGRQGNEAFLRSGQLLVVVIPKFSSTETQPRVGYHSLIEVENFLRERISTFADLRVINPVYEKVKLSCRLKLSPRCDLQRGKSWDRLHEAILAHICPWLTTGALQLGGSISKNELLTTIKEHECVDFVTAFSLVHIYEKSEDDYFLEDTARPDSNAELLTARRPWSVLVPVDSHQITFLDEEAYQLALPSSLDIMRLETDFIITDEDDFDPPSPYDRVDGETDKDDPTFNIPRSWLRGQ